MNNESKLSKGTAYDVYEVMRVVVHRGVGSDERPVGVRMSELGHWWSIDCDDGYTRVVADNALSARHRATLSRAADETNGRPRVGSRLIAAADDEEERLSAGVLNAPVLIRHCSLIKPTVSLRNAMQAMSNATACMGSAAKLCDALLSVYQRDQSEADRPYLYGTEKEVASREWSAKVRAGVAALRPPGPVVSCQGDWEDD